MSPPYYVFDNLSVLSIYSEIPALINSGPTEFSKFPKALKIAQKRECINNFEINQLKNFQLVGLASSAFGVYYILDKERVQMHQVILVNLQDIKGQAHDMFSRIFRIRIFL